MKAKEFCAAVKVGDIALVQQMVQTSPQLVHNACEESMGLPLHTAVLNRDAAMTRLLMESGADARLGIWPHRDATTAHIIACDRGYDDVLLAIEESERSRRRAASVPNAPIDLRSDQINRAILQDHSDDAIAILQSDLSLVGACNIGQPINGIDCRRLRDGATPLHAAAWKHNTRMVRWLIQHGACVDAQDCTGQTPLDYAATMAGWSSHGRDFAYLENSTLDPACFVETVRLLREKGVELTSYSAVATGDREAINRLHREGRLHNNDYGRGGLLAIAVKVNRIEMVALLLDLGFDANEPNEHSNKESISGVPLWFASMCGRHDIAELLISRGADVNAVFNGNADALSCAEVTGDEKMQSLLLKHGARITVERVAGRKDRVTARAILEGKIPGSSLNVDNPTHTELAEQMLWAAGSCDEEIVRMCLRHIHRLPGDPWWNYVLMHATRLECMKLILEHGVDPDVPGVGGHSTLQHLASASARDDNRTDRAALLLNVGASLQKRDELLNSSPLGWACRWGRMELVDLYLGRGAPVNEMEADLWATPLAWASRYAHRAVADRLRAHGAK